MGQHAVVSELIEAKKLELECAVRVAEINAAWQIRVAEIAAAASVDVAKINKAS